MSTLPFILSEWPRVTARGALPQWDQYFDGQVHVIPQSPRYKDIHGFRKAITSRAAQLQVKIRTCTLPEHPGCLIVQTLGPLEYEV